MVRFLVTVLALALTPILWADTVLTFEGFPDSTILTTQYPNVAFTNAIILTAGISLNEFEFPPHSGANVASDNGGAMSISFSTPVQSFAGYFTYAEQLTIDAYGAGNTLLASVTSPYSNNEALSGVPGSTPDQLLRVSGSGIVRVSITGDPAGGSFVIDDATYGTAVPEPASARLFGIVALCVGFFAFWRRGNVWARTIASFMLLIGIPFVCTAATGVQSASAAPNSIQVNVPTSVTFTATINDPTLIPNSVNLLRDINGAYTLIGSLQSQGNGMYAIDVPLNEPRPGAISFRVSVAFRGILRRIEVPLLVNAVVPPDTTVSSISGTVDSTGGSVAIPNVGKAEVPPGAVPDSATLTLAAINSPLMLSLAQDLDPAFSLVSTPQILFTSSLPLSQPVQLRFSVPTPNGNSTPTVVALVTQTASDGEEIQGLMSLGGSMCGPTTVCATVLPAWMVSTNPDVPNQVSIQAAVGTTAVTTASAHSQFLTGPQNQAIALTTGSPIHLWTVDNLAPSGDSVTVSPSDDISVSATLLFQNPNLFPPLSGTLVVTDTFGFSRFRLHKGVDLRAADGTAVFNALDGIGSNGFDPGIPGSCSGTPTALGYGQNVIMSHGSGNFLTRYAHLDSSLVSPGQFYSEGAQIALSDTDHTCAPHLHFEVRLADPPNQIPQPIDPAPLLPVGHFPDDYAGGLQFEILVDGHLADLEDSGSNFTFSTQLSGQDVISLLDPGSGPHLMELLLVSPTLGVHSLHSWNVQQGQTPAVLLNPFGAQTSAGPYNINVVNQDLSPTTAPQDITVTLLRDVISQCSGLLFSSDRTVVVSQGQPSATYNFNAGRDPACPSLPITTQYTITMATMTGQTLNLSVVPQQQLTLSITR